MAATMTVLVNSFRVACLKVQYTTEQRNQIADRLAEMRRAGHNLSGIAADLTTVELAILDARDERDALYAEIRTQRAAS